MLEKDVLTTIFELIFIKGLSMRKVSAELGIHRSTISKYVDIMEKNLSELKSELILEGKCSEHNFDRFVITNLNDYIDKIIYYTNTRNKRVLSEDIVDAISKLAEHLDTKSPTVIYNYIDENLKDSALYDLSYASIRRALKTSRE